eukprot:CAMPEP_0176104564 /NCGR_PEP_ID=MMETSP0120_2-20121206/52470_1 /TAXON_ID=160619 /ORGANISM="Kryptoperidinium foliaceum, Strain CCMP 1326" /LENGTH=215 /DNA_ID=CAMNT_0017438673 /DNA_START=64 /DNA_END=708 /DNA_ORIENTATION=+
METSALWNQEASSSSSTTRCSWRSCGQVCGGFGGLDNGAGAALFGKPSCVGLQMEAAAAHDEVAPQLAAACRWSCSMDGDAVMEHIGALLRGVLEGAAVFGTGAGCNGLRHVQRDRSSSGEIGPDTGTDLLANGEEALPQTSDGADFLGVAAGSAGKPDDAFYIAPADSNELGNVGPQPCLEVEQSAARCESLLMPLAVRWKERITVVATVRTQL